MNKINIRYLEKLWLSYMNLTTQRLLCILNFLNNIYIYMNILTFNSNAHFEDLIFICKGSRSLFNWIERFVLLKYYLLIPIGLFIWPWMVEMIIPLSVLHLLLLGNWTLLWKNQKILYFFIIFLFLDTGSMSRESYKEKP